MPSTAAVTTLIEVSRTTSKDLTRPPGFSAGSDVLSLPGFFLTRTLRIRHGSAFGVDDWKGYLPLLESSDAFRWWSEPFLQDSPKYSSFLFFFPYSYGLDRLGFGPF